MDKENLIILTNEKIYENNGSYCDNIDIKNLSEKLNNYFNVCLIGRKSSQKRFHQINLKNIRIFKNIFSSLYNLSEFTFNKNTKYLIVSITPFTFFNLILLKVFKKKVFIYFRSDGFSEYKKIIGFLGPIIYGAMFFISTKLSILISCRNYILRGRKGLIVRPSQLNDKWLSNKKNSDLSGINLLYVGRLKIEKGVYSLAKILKNKENISLTMLGAENFQLNNFEQKNVEVLRIESNEDKLIDLYDSHNIFILPSFTEGHPMVLLEALSRLRPVIVFKEIEHVIGNKKGIFVSERNYDSLEKTIQHIIKNYKSIQEEMKKNILPTNYKFIEDFKNIILDN
tara:strand:+ start:118 stop:1137 length:1020 start_codon:yes stop_codon:yes gene_type:complete